MFCRPQRWQPKNTAGELQSLWLLIISFCRGIGLIWRAFLNRKTATLVKSKIVYNYCCFYQLVCDFTHSAIPVFSQLSLDQNLTVL
ncbi:MAG UNVERIFIED_CONTAM: hypothetical protein LVR29_07520 [Microcystis novacekii LVE1205-3]